LATNIGIHFFDLLIWLFGPVQESEVHVDTPYKVGGYIELPKARVKWFLSIDRTDLPDEIANLGQSTFRSITINGEEVEFSGGFTDLHTEVYRGVLEGKGYGLKDSKPSIELVHEIRNAHLTPINDKAHPFSVKAQKK
jgi:UDP-N-acetyl-2-amino-2-deoxyglucuronate dehydrogenase